MINVTDSCGLSDLVDIIFHKSVVSLPAGGALYCANTDACLQIESDCACLLDIVYFALS